MPVEGSGPVDRHPRIKLITDVYNIKQLEGLFHECHAMIYPSNGEGFGLIPFQAIATGMPTAAVVWGGIEEFGEYCLPIDHTVGDSGHSYHLGEWAFPDFNSVCDVMYDIRHNYERYADLFYEHALNLHRRFQWTDIIYDALKHSGVISD